MFIIIEENMRDFNPLEDIEILCQTEDTFIVRTWKLIETLQFIQQAWWKLRQLIPDDEWESEFNILAYYKCKNT
jgi:hypothetical protein